MLQKPGRTYFRRRLRKWLLPFVCGHGFHAIQTILLGPGKTSQLAVDCLQCLVRSKAARGALVLPVRALFGRLASEMIQNILGTRCCGLMYLRSMN